MPVSFTLRSCSDVAYVTRFVSLDRTKKDKVGEHTGKILPSLADALF